MKPSMVNVPIIPAGTIIYIRNAREADTVKRVTIKSAKLEVVNGQYVVLYSASNYDYYIKEDNIFYTPEEAFEDK